MTIRDVEKVAATFLYESYLRPSTLIAPGEAMQTECLVEGDAATTFDIRVRFLQLTPKPVERTVVGATSFEWPPLSGAVDVSTVLYADRMIRLRVRIVNTSRAPGPSLVAPHVILRVSDGEFLSMIDPPEIYRKLAENCKNIRTWPVLAGERGQHRTMLSSPVIVYDYPEIADE